MKLSKYIESLQEVLVKEGDLDCYYAVDEGSGDYEDVIRDCSIMCNSKKHSFFNNLISEKLAREFYDIKDYDKVICVN